MSQRQPEYERGYTHGQHDVKFYWILAAVLVVSGTIGGIVFRPESWPMHRAIFTGVMMTILGGYCVFAWHWLMGPVRRQPLEDAPVASVATEDEQAP